MKAEIKLGTLIEATMRPIDTIPAMLREAERRGLNWQKIIEDSNGQFTYEDSIGAAMDTQFDPDPDAPYWNNVKGHDHAWTSDEDAIQTVSELIDLLNEDLSGATFGTHEGDGACLGYWPNEGDGSGEGVHFEWEEHYGNTLLKAKDGGETHLLQGDDSGSFLREIGAVDFVWMNDPQNEEGRVFKTIKEHYDAIMDPYFNND